MTDKIILVGGGGHALSLLEAIEAPNAVEGYLDLRPSQSMTMTYLGDDTMAKKFMEHGALFHISYVYHGIPDMTARKRLIEQYDSLGADFATIVAPTAVVTPHSCIGEGAAILNGAIINRAQIGRHAVINSGAIIEHDCTVGENTFIGPGAIVGGGTLIGQDCFIGLGARLKNGIKIAPGTVIGMGAVVTNNIQEPGIYHGFPLHKYKGKK